MTLLDTMKARKAPPASIGPQAINPTPASLPKSGEPFAASSAPATVPSIKPGLPSRAQAESARTLPQADPDVPDEPEAQQAPPWAVGACKSCEGIGFNSVGNPCRICDSSRAKMQGITSAMFNIEVTEDGISWSPKASCYDALIAAGYSEGDMEPVSMTGEGEAQVRTVEAHPELEIGEPLPTAAVLSPSLMPQQRGPGRPKKNQVSVTGTETGTINKVGFVLMLGCHARSPESKVVYMEELLASVGLEIAAQSNLKSYYEADIWRRRDALAGAAPMVAQRLQGSILIVNRLTKDNEVLIDALSALAVQVFEADDFYVKAGK